MHASSILAISGALLSAVTAIPMAEQHHYHHHLAHKREIVWETVTDEVIVTVPVTKTVWIEPGQETPAAKAAPSSASDVQPADYSPSAYSTPSQSVPAATAYAPVSSFSASAYTPPSQSSSNSPAASASTPSSQSSANPPVAPAYVAPTESFASSPSPYVPPTTSSAPVYVVPTTSVAPTTYAPPTSLVSAPASSSSSSGSTGSDGIAGQAAPGTYYTGDLTWYDVGLGACGWTNVASEPVVAIAKSIFDAYNGANPNNNPLCGKYVTITGKDGVPHQAKIVDRCVGCNAADLDLSEDFFNTVTSDGDGRVHNMRWCFD